MLTIVELRSSVAQLTAQQGEPRPVSIVSLIPVLHTKTLTVKAEARGTKVYPLVVTFYNVDYSLERDPEHPLVVRPRIGEPFFMRPASEVENPVQVRCQCPFFRFVWAEWDKKNKALSGPVFPAYIRKTSRAARPEVNPTHVPGVCKHLIGIFNKLRAEKILGN